MNTTTFEFSYDKSDLTQFFVNQWGAKYRVKTRDGGNSRCPADPLIFVDSWSIDSKGWCPCSLMTEQECKSLFVGYWVDPKLKENAMKVSSIIFCQEDNWISEIHGFLLSLPEQEALDALIANRKNEHFDELFNWLLTA